MTTSSLSFSKPIGTNYKWFQLTYEFPFLKGKKWAERSTDILHRWGQFERAYESQVSVGICNADMPIKNTSEKKVEATTG
jgi:hypothetical protein